MTAMSIRRPLRGLRSARLLPAFALLACGTAASNGGPAPGPAAPGPAGATAARDAGAPSHPVSRDGLTEIRFRTTITQPWCSGAAPAEGVLEELNRPVPTGGLWRVRPGKRDSQVASIATGESGHDDFVFRVPPGTYCVVEADRPATPPPLPDGADARCWAELHTACTAVIEVTPGSPSSMPVAINRYAKCAYDHNRPCFPQRELPKPPSAAPR